MLSIAYTDFDLHTFSVMSLKSCGQDLSLTFFSLFRDFSLCNVLEKHLLVTTVGQLSQCGERPLVFINEITPVSSSLLPGE